MGERRTFANRYAISVRRVVASERTETADMQLGITLTFVAGAINAGGFLAVGQYTSHMSGIFSAMADNLALGAFGLVVLGLGAFVPFIVGAACSAMLINWGRRQRRGSQYALPLTLEAVLLLCFGIFGVIFRPTPESGLAAVPLLTFIMGLQNATVTKISGARMRTTHITGIVTDIGIELGKLFYWNRLASEPERPAVMADRRKLRLLSSLLGSFFAGGVLGALGFKYIGFLACVPLALLLLALVLPSLAQDMKPQR
ncbi:YoaK family protein [Microvirga flavescens]|uniref:YoaK family protein n=1 Tax=Microvirga flavescens TaxID=2249811 RepID=UPI000DD69791